MLFLSLLPNWHLSSSSSQLLALFLVMASRQHLPITDHQLALSFLGFPSSSHSLIDHRSLLVSGLLEVLSKPSDHRHYHQRQNQQSSPLLNLLRTSLKALSTSLPFLQLDFATSVCPTETAIVQLLVVSNSFSASSFDHLIPESTRIRSFSFLASRLPAPALGRMIGLVTNSNTCSPSGWLSRALANTFTASYLSSLPSPSANTLRSIVVCSFPSIDEREEQLIQRDFQLLQQSSSSSQAQDQDYNQDHDQERLEEFWVQMWLRLLLQQELQSVGGQQIADELLLTLFCSPHRSSWMIAKKIVSQKSGGLTASLKTLQQL